MMTRRCGKMRCVLAFLTMVLEFFGVMMVNTLEREPCYKLFSDNVYAAFTGFCLVNRDKRRRSLGVFFDALSLECV